MHMNTASEVGKILWLMPTLGAGGAERVTLNVIEELSHKGLQVDLLVIKKVQCYDCPRGLKLLWLYEEGVRLRYKVAGLLYRLIQIFRNYDLIIVGLEVDYPLLLLPLLLGKKRITVVHSKLSAYVYGKKTLWRRLKYIVHRAYGSYDKIVVVSPAIKRDLMENYSIDSQRIVYIRNGVRFSDKSFAAAPLREKFDSRPVNILSAGRLSEEKNFPFLLRVFADCVSRRDGQDLTLTICGEGPQLDCLRKLAQDLKIHDRVGFPGFVRKIEDYYQKAAIYIQTSVWEGFGMALLEAMQYGAPVISSRCEGPAEILRGSPLLISGYHTDDYSRAVMRLMGDREFYARMSDFSLARSKMFDIENTAVQYKRLFEEELCSGRGSQ